jgi:hypothetical protein
MKTWKVGDAIPFRVRIDGDPATDNPTATIYDETGAAEPTLLTIGAGLTQVGTTKVVTGSFTPDAVGEWAITIKDDAGLDLVKQYIVRDDSVESIGAKLDAQDSVLSDILANTAGGGGHFG